MKRLAALAAVAVLAACGGDDGSVEGGGDDATTTTAVAEGPTVTVLSRNLYLGADLLPLFEASAEELTTVATATWQAVIDSLPAERMAMAADEIVELDPDVVALQEATLWSIQAEGATEGVVEYDLLALLLAELEERGEPYTAVASGDGFAGGLPVEGIGLVQMQDRDVLLVRADAAIEVGDVRQGSFDARMTVEVVGAPIEVVRGFAAADLTVEGVAVTVVNTHLEAFDDPVRDAQQAELLAALDPDTPTLVLGDLNSASTGEDAAAYEAMLDAGFVDAWSVNGDEDGFTCCFSADVREGALDSRIDFVLARGGFEPRSAEVVGGAVLDPVAPSDHAGVVAVLAVPA